MSPRQLVHHLYGMALMGGAMALIFNDRPAKGFLVGCMFFVSGVIQQKSGRLG